ncbi:gamma-tubulin complex component [Sporothrix brasiliensis 5110]|uniref:Spindle pole body component n=1 Tax=Sporothrix brasiliensis 5110 TaxID=1398154 RepID=A0A0C2IN21_9PEZI|nr:gamma-tubulin complex component [Sporothrix brasiliensis 5110]KIH88400.1 gamma-tubulin complex component [Sporothrix brasiliensis 5110]
MAFLATLSAQTEELVAAVTEATATTDSSTFAALCDATLRALRNHNNLRTNQFEVESQLDGLAERFAVAGRDALAGALRERRTALTKHDPAGQPLTTKWTPEVLHFLLELSDRPATRPGLLDDLDALIASRHMPEPPPLRWEDIMREDGWASEADVEEDDYDDDDDYVDRYGYDDDESGYDDDTTMSSIEADDHGQARTYRDLIATDGHTRDELATLLTSIRESQSWRTARPPDAASGEDAPNNRVLVSELQIVRDTLFMLQGLDTTLFGRDCVLVDKFRLSDVSVSMHTSLLDSVADCGRRLLPLRKRAGLEHSQGRQRNDAAPSIPLLQVFQEAIQRRLHAFDKEVTSVQARFVTMPSDGCMVSLVGVLNELQPSLQNLFALSGVVEKLDAAERGNAYAFRYLELLFDATAIAQYEGSANLYEFLGTIFFDCFQVYLRPIRSWMEEGVLDRLDKAFFVSGGGPIDASVPLHQIWNGQYKLLRTTSGVLHAPRFLQPAASKIFTTGKSIVVLRHLGKDPGRARASIDNRHITDTEPRLDFGTVCPPDAAMAPFAQLFGDAFDHWIQSKHHAASATLQATLVGACGLGAALESLHRVFLMADGAAADAFASRVFHSLDTRNPRWLDRYTMTEMIREAYGESGALSVALEKQGLHPDSDDPLVARRSVRDGLARIRPTYRLAWPVQIVIPAASLAGYQSVFTLLLQIRRASALLSRHRLLDDGQGEQGDEDDNSNGNGGGGRGHALPSGDRALYFSLRARLLWFCNTLQSYLTTLVIAPRVERLRQHLLGQNGATTLDVDDMIAVHAQFVRSLVDEALLGGKLEPLHAGMLDLLDLALRLEDAHRANGARVARALRETWRLSVLSASVSATPTSRQYQTPTKRGRWTGPSPRTGADSVRRTLFLASPRRPRGRDVLGDDNVDGDVDDDDDDYDYDGYDDEAEGQNNDNDENDDSYETKNATKTNTQEMDYSSSLRAIRSDLDNTLRFVTSGLRGVARASRDATAAAKWDMLAEMLGDDGSGRSERSRW